MADGTKVKLQLAGHDAGGNDISMLAANLLYELHPDRYRELEAQLRVEKLPHVSLIITSLRTKWIE